MSAVPPGGNDAHAGLAHASTTGRPHAASGIRPDGAPEMPYQAGHARVAVGGVLIP